MNSNVDIQSVDVNVFEIRHGGPSKLRKNGINHVKKWTKADFSTHIILEATNLVTFMYCTDKK